MMDWGYHSRDINSQVGKGGLPPCVSNTQPQIVSPEWWGRSGNERTHIRVERSGSAGVNRPSQPANFRMLISIPDRI